MSPKQRKNLAEVRKPQSQTPETTPTLKMSNYPFITAIGDSSTIGITKSR